MGKEWSVKTSDVTRAALSLPIKERARLASRLIASVDAPTKHEIDEAWSIEAENRMRDIQEGRSKTVAWPEVWKNTLARKQK